MKGKKIIAAVLAVLICAFCCPTAAFAKAGEYVTVGGFAIGLELNIDGVAVVDVNEKTCKDFCVGDIIKKVGGEKVNDLESLKSAVRGAGNNFTAEVLRDGKTVTVTAKKDRTGALGITVRDSLRGVGTVTYVKADNTFASLGHPVGSTKAKAPLAISGGSTSSAIVLGVNKGEKGKAGELKAVFVEKDELRGKIISNTNFGVYGKLEKAVKNPLYEKKVKIASRDEVALGKATILSTVDGKTVREYDIEIVSKASQNKPEEKGLVIRVVDKDLLEKTGGIVQGMSGSPIMQNGKLVGAVTHVFLNDSTRGYGIFAEFMG